MVTRKKSKQRETAALCAYSISVASGRTRASFLNLSWVPHLFIGDEQWSPKANVTFRTSFPVQYDPEEKDGVPLTSIVIFPIWYFILMHSFIWKWIKQVFCPRIFSYVVFKLCVFFCLVSTLDYLYWVILDPVITHVREPGRAGNLKKMWKIFCRTPGFLRKKRIEGHHEIQFRYQ